MTTPSNLGPGYWTPWELGRTSSKPSPSFSETSYTDLPPIARERLGTNDAQKNVLVHLALRPVDRTQRYGSTAASVERRFPPGYLMPWARQVSGSKRRHHVSTSHRS